MKYLKIFEDYQDIHDICKKYDIKNYTINSDGSIDVDGIVNLSNKNLSRLPLRFGKVSGDFDCSYNQLTSLEGCPQSVGDDFVCNDNQLTSLEGWPQTVGGDFYCGSNQLTSLEGCPQSVVGNFFCGYNRLISLEGCPQSVGKGFYCNNNQLTSLNGCPVNIKFIECQGNPIYFWWKRIYYMKYLEIFIDMNIHSDDPDEINQEKIDIILEQ